MLDPITTLAERFERALVNSFGDDVAGTDPLLRPSDHADYQANLAMSLAKRLKRAPRQVAEALIQKLEVEDICDKVEIAGPGFINLTLKSEFIAELAEQQLGDPRLGAPRARAPETVVVDYSSPNVAKEMHVGHIRSTIIGDALARILDFAGHDVIRQNHLGDWGTPFGMLIEHLVDEGESAAALEVSDLNAFYQAARKKFDADPAFADRSRQRVVLLQGGDEKTLALWRQLVEQSKRYFAQIYQRLGVLLNDGDICAESFYNPRLAGVAEELKQKQLAVADGGALVMFIPGFQNKEGNPLPLIVQKRDGGYGYATTDLAGIRYRIQELGATRILYVVGSPQHQHLSMVFEAARMAGWLTDRVRAQHVSFGSMLGADGKMFRTRGGETVKLSDLLDEAQERALAEVEKRCADLEPEVKAAVSEQVGVGALKYGDLSSDRVKDYVFDFDRMIKFEGSTGGYSQYAHARCCSILRRAGGDPGAGRIQLNHPAERALALALLRFGGVVQHVAESLEPHTLCNYLYDVSSALSKFYDACQVLKAEGDALRQSRLRLVQLTSRVLAQALGLLGVAAPERM